MPSDLRRAAGVLALSEAAGKPWGRASRRVVAALVAGGDRAWELRAPEAAVEAWQARLEALAASHPDLQVVTVLDSAYPPALRGLAAAPAFLFVRGSLPAGERAVAVVGTRAASPEGLAAARRLGRELAGDGWVVVSGLARGIDAQAHRGALDIGGRTVAVVGTGILTTYPPEHAGLARAISRCGAVVSQLWPWSPPSPEGFRRRDRLSAGLTAATLVVEAGERSGARLQARLALEQGRPVLVTRGLAANQAWGRALVASGRAAVADTASEVAAAIATAAPPSTRHAGPPEGAGQLRLL